MRYPGGVPGVYSAAFILASKALHSSQLESIDLFLGAIVR